jgi:hypothetical protein
VDTTEVAPDGWVVTDTKTFQLIANHPPPRPYGYLHQLRVDAGSKRVIKLWVLGIGIIAIGVQLGWWALLPVGIGVFALWFTMFRNTVRFFRECRTGVGLVGALKPHPVLDDCSTGVALTIDGQEVSVYLPTRLVGEIIGRDGRAEVLFVHDPRKEWAFGIGARAAPGAGYG